MSRDVLLSLLQYQVSQTKYSFLLTLTSFYETDFIKESNAESYSNFSNFLWKDNLNIGLLIMHNYNKFPEVCLDAEARLVDEVLTLKSDLYSKLKGKNQSNLLFFNSGEFLSQKYFITFLCFLPVLILRFSWLLLLTCRGLHFYLLFLHDGYRIMQFRHLILLITYYYSSIPEFIRPK